MPDHAVTYPADAGAATFLLTVRGKPAAAAIAESRAIHNATAGAPQSAAAARSLGDLSHNVYTSVDDSLGEILFIDLWNSMSGLGQFFANPQVQDAAAKLFAGRDASVWSATDGFGSFPLAVPAGRAVTGVGILRATVTSIDAAAGAFRSYASTTINQARARGIVSHTNWVPVPNPGEQQVSEVIGIDLWLDADEMGAYYALGLGFDHLAPVFAGPPDTSTWKSAPGDWAEW